MSGFFQNLLKDTAESAFGSDYLRDYTHASKAFRPNMYANTPKLKFLFHTVFNINPDILSKTAGTPPNFGLFVRDIKLPSFSFNTHTLNQYNRKRIVQTKIKYDPISITFNDDNGNTINKLWAAYYTYYYADGSKPQIALGKGKTSDNVISPSGGITDAVADYNSRAIYNSFAEAASSDSNDWGYIGEPPNATSPTTTKVKAPFFNNITVFGFHSHSFVAYVLVNPIITAFAHDTYNYDEGNGIMKNTMTVDYETVVYKTGAISGTSPGDIIAGFGDQATYDSTLSPIAKPGSNANMLGQGGLIDAAGGAVNNILSGNGSLKDILNAGRAYNTFKNIDVKQTLKAELTGMLSNAINNTPNTRNANFDFPTRAATPATQGQAGQPTSGAKTSPPAVTPTAAPVPTNSGSQVPNPSSPPPPTRVGMIPPS